jgi:glucose/arabinose dehydrogenase
MPMTASGLRRIARSTLGLSVPLALAAVAIATALAVDCADAQTQLPDRFIDQIVASGLNDPVGMAFLPDGRLVVVERAGAVRLIVEGKLGAFDPMIVVDSVEVSGDRGLTGVAVDPQWPTRPFIYLYYDHMAGNCRIARYTATGILDNPSGLVMRLDPASRYDVLRDVPDLQDIHNGGTLRFGVDGFLYAALGDDGNGCAAQDTISLRGVMLRLDVRYLPAGPGGPANKALLAPPDNPLAGYPNANARLIWATGLRNPFRFHIDPITTNIFIGDVGFNLFEEVDLVAGGFPDFGWPYFEGPAGFVTSCPGILPDPSPTPGIYAYDRSGFTAAVISAGVYRTIGCSACSFPQEYDGDYFFSDFYDGFMRRLKFTDNGWQLAAPVQGQPNALDWGRGFQEIADYLNGPDGALWYCKMSYDFTPGTGEIRRVYYESPVNSVTDRPTAGVELAPAHPTPSRGRVELAYTLARGARTELRIIDAAGRIVRIVQPAATRAAGRQPAVWDGDDADGRRVAPGIYLAQLVVDGRGYPRRVAMLN